MAVNDIKIRSVAGLSALPTLKFATAGGGTAIYAGEFVKFSANGSSSVDLLADAYGAIGTDIAIVGLAKSDSTHTATAKGEVEVYLPIPGVVYEIKAKTGTTADTQGEIDALVGDRVILDLTSGVYTLDTAATEAQASPFLIVGGDPIQKTLYVILRSGATILGDQDIA